MVVAIHFADSVLVPQEIGVVSLGARLSILRVRDLLFLFSHFFPLFIFEVSLVAYNIHIYVQTYIGRKEAESFTAKPKPTLIKK